MVELATTEPKWLNNEIIVFYLTHKFYPQVQIKGCLDMDYFEERDNPIQFFDENKELQWDYPDNPYEFPSAEYKAFNEVINDFEKNILEIIEKLEDCVGVEHYQFEWFNIEMESLKW